MALSDREGETELVLRDDFAMGSATGNASIAISSQADLAFRKLQVPMQRLDAVLANGANAIYRVAKVDIEGHEDFFLRGASGWLRRDRPVILLEVNNWFYEMRGTTSTSVFSPAVPEDYKVLLLRPRNGHCSAVPIAIGQLEGLRRVESCLIYPPEREGEVLRALH